MHKKFAQPLMRFFIGAGLLLATLAAPSFIAPANGDEFRPLTIYYVRHAQTEANRTHVYNDLTEKMLSEQGKHQVEELAKKLDGMEFDHIIVSPQFRAMATTLPYLKSHNRTAEIWPEMSECCWQKERRENGRISLDYGEEIELADEFRHYFKVRDDSPPRKFHLESYGDGVEQVRLGVELLKKKYSGSGKKILVVGHYHSGSRTMEFLQGEEPAGDISLSNAKVSELVEQPDGHFRILKLNQ